MEFKIYYNAEISNNIYNYYNVIKATNIEEAKEKFIKKIKEYYCKPAKIEIVKICEIKEGDKK